MTTGPLFILFRSIRLRDKPIALVAVNRSVVVPYAIWMIKGFMDALPMDMEEDAMMDGASRFRALIDVVIPVAMPGIVTATMRMIACPLQPSEGRVLVDGEDVTYDAPKDRDIVMVFQN